MRRIRLYSDQPMQTDDLIELEGRPAHHLLRVLRRRAGDHVTLFNGDGQEHEGRITELTGRDRCRLQLTRSTRPDAESPLEITLIQAVGRGDRMDWALQKSVELGVAGLQPVLSERTEVRLAGSRADKRMAHWQSVVIAACEQSGRVRIPTLHPLCDIGEVGAAPSMDALSLYLDPEGEGRLDDLNEPGGKAIRLAVGPEGGFSDRDMKGLRQSGFVGMKLGPRVLRTETAGPAVLAILQSRWGDLSGAPSP